MDEPSDRRSYTHLTELNGVDEMTAKRLYEAGYQQLYHITSASQNMIQQVDGITPGLASHIKTQAEAAESKGGLSIETTDTESETSTSQSGRDSTDSATSASSAEAWPMYRGNPARTGIQPHATPPTEKPSQQRVFDAIKRQNRGTDVVRTPVVADDTVYLSIGPLIYAVDSSTGNVIWQFDTNARNPANTSMPTINDGSIYVGSTAQCLHALNSSDGTESWQFKMDQSAVTSPVVAGGYVYTGELGGMLYAVDTETGTEQWRFDTEAGGLTRIETPAVADGTIYATTSSKLYALDAKEGAEHWRFDGDPPLSWAAVSDEMVYLGGERVLAIDKDEGTIQWEFSPGRHSTASAPAVHNETVYVGGEGYVEGAESDDRGVYALDATCGEVIWYQETNTVNPPVVANGTVYVSEDERENNQIRALDADTGDEQWRLNLHADNITTPAIAGETIYVGCANDGVYSLTTR